MITSWLSDVVSYSLQLTALVATVVVVTTVVPVRDARWRFLLYQALFVAALLLPISQLWGNRPTPGSVNAVSTIIRTAESSTIGTRVSWLEIAAFVIAGGASIHLGHLALGWFAIRRYVRRSTPVERSADWSASSAGGRADVRLSNDVRSPASVGVWRAVILVPPGFLTLSPAAQRSVLLHEFLHVERRDWARMVIEEIWCALLWFHPFARVLVRRLDLAREMLVDRCVLDATRDRRAYARALLAFADDEGSAAHAVMPLTRPRHLSDRIAAVVKEVPMSRRATLAALCVIGLSVATTTATAVHLVPMGAQPPSPAEPFATASAQADEVVQPGEGVTLPKPTYEQKPYYTPEAMQAEIEGTVLLAIVVETDGTVGRVRVTKSLDTTYGLDDAAITAARLWRFEPGRKDGKPVPVEVSLEFRFTLRH